MRVKTRRWLVVYGIVAHALAALLYWQNANLRGGVDDSMHLAALRAGGLCEAGCRYQAMMVEHLASALRDTSVSLHLLGDSIIAQLPVGQFDEPASNLGIPGDLSSGLAFRISRYPFVEAEHRAVVHIGINDVLRGDDAHVPAAVRGIVEALSARGVRTVLSTLLPVDEQVAGLGINARVRELNTQLKKTCGAVADCALADAGDAMTDADGQLRPALHTGDGIHLNADGYKIFMRAVRGALEQLSTRTS